MAFESVKSPAHQFVMCFSPAAPAIHPEFTHPPLSPGPMVRTNIFLAVVLATQAVAMTPALADPKPKSRHCLTQEQRRAALASHKAMRAGRAIAIAKKRYGGDVVRARLCEGEHGSLRYVLTVLARDGKVTRVAVDATSGKLLSAR
ncbi:MAG: PepSY domain-containing protein [Variibacter sp.]